MTIRDSAGGTFLAGIHDDDAVPEALGSHAEHATELASAATVLKLAPASGSTSAAAISAAAARTASAGTFRLRPTSSTERRRLSS